MIGVQLAPSRRTASSRHARPEARHFATGRSLHPGRAAHDFYPTPPEAVRALLSVESFDGSIWEPACGDGAISRTLIEAGHPVVSTDLIDRGYCQGGIDFLAERTPRARHIITNPPYGRGLADAFIRHALILTRETGGSVAMLLNLASLAHPCRHAKFVKTPPAAIYALDDVTCWPNGRPAEPTRSITEQRYCWMVRKPGQRFDIHQHITDQIIAAIERGAGEFRLPWHRSAGNIMRPVNIASKKPYRGVNILTLWAIADEKGYTAGTWGTYKQWAEAGAQVRKGEKSAYIVFYKEITVASDDDSDESDTRLFARATPVFAAEQVDGYAAPVIETPATIITPIEQAEAFAAKTGATIHHGGTRAFYRPSTDSIQLPPHEAFLGTATSTPAEAYYSTLLHELTHFTSHETRCNRQLGKRFGDDAYAMEKLIAELGAAFLCADLGITSEPRADHAQYLDHWLGVMKADKKAIFTAASKASEAAAFLAAHQGA